MKDLLKKPVTFEKAEFWLATAIYVCSVYVLAYNLFIQISTGDVHTFNVDLFNENFVPYSYLKYYFIPQFLDNTLYYACFLLFNFQIVPALVNGRYILLNILLLLVAFTGAVAAIGTADTWMKWYLSSQHTDQYIYRRVFKEAFLFCVWALLIFGLYTVCKYVLKQVFRNIQFPTNLEQVNRECIGALMVTFFITGFLGWTARWETAVLTGEVMIYGIAMYYYCSYMLVPKALAKNNSLAAYLPYVCITLAVTFLPVTLIGYIFFQHITAALAVNLADVGIGALVAAPLAWYMYKNRLNKNQELYGLKTALGQSSANLDLLRSQINPHFLFNALNTLYGTSLQEHAERTSEGIQKLGDMMRFMLQENVQDQISLMREIDYLKNYIDLQKLRTQTSPDINIITEIDDEVNGAHIAPMLLIPFVENAFKHGISLQEPSHIKISMQTRNDQLLFDVYNSIHQKTGTDPEKDKSGIGLENVKQRLVMLYPNRHELVIRESAKEFFIHLTLKLNQPA